ncbi:class I SAM-dependent DNA methyltransferase [Salibaculum griseiflavum]|uniref:site-specific DNA-methyltransferase (adenine-specific) n=1 Tax=Salibaculum griseiflavum TaxID=1914409 RepID=A0A2V1NZB0_9RHOB|nr:DNA methyltransferase [Salibaculum griseiflavum]PWG15651.1 lactate dehydrogenase [Salibaculum griseiflavum]
MNVVDIEENVQELVSKGFNPDTFILDFVKAYDAPKALIQQLKGGHQNLSDVPGAVLWRRNLHYKLASKGQVAAVIAELERSQATSKYKARFVISTDGDEFSARDLVSGNTINCHFDELAVHFASFLSLAGIFIDEAIEENPIDIKATKRLTKFYDSILQDNPTWKTDEMRHTLNHFITQVIFCLFAEDTGIIADNIFTDTIRTYCESDSEQAQPVITAIFTAMAHSEGAEARASLPAYAQKFPHVNGGLFRGDPQVPRFLRGSVRYLMDAGALDWKEINPDIFGSMIQAIVHQDQRGELGMHYTSVSNILKLLKPLFLHDLQEQVRSSWNSKKGLQNVLQRLMKIRVFDPACGSGNFLVIAYRELRNIEIQVIRRLAEISDFSAGIWSHVELKNFFGIEYIDFASETAKLSLWIAEYQMNKRYEDEFGKLPPSLPLKDTNNIRHGNALRIAWESVCPHSDDPEVETYIVGNPPYLGYNKQTPEQKRDVENTSGKIVKNWRSLDYISAWFAIASLYLDKRTECAFVSTNSIVQGEQATLLWEPIFNLGVSINLASQKFKWSNNAANIAGVTCVVVGLNKNPNKLDGKIFGDRYSKRVSQINQYLLPADKIFIRPSNTPISNLKRMPLGNMAKDGGYLFLDSLEMQDMIDAFPESREFILPAFGSQEVIKGMNRYCLWIPDSRLNCARKIPPINERLKGVEKMRLNSPAESTKSYAKYPNRFKQIQGIGERNTLIIPRVFSETRYWPTVAFIDHPCVVTDLAYLVADPPKYYFSIVSSKTHLIWVQTISGKLESRIRYSNTMCWHTFPVPDLTGDDKAALTKCAEDILLARDHYFEHTLAELYDPKNMEKKFPELWEAHQRNDEVLETIYNGKPFENDTERLEHLFARYVEMTSKLASKQKGAKK